MELGLAYEVTQANEIKLGNGPVLLLPGEHTRKADTYRHLEAGTNVNVPCGAQLNCVANASVESRTGVRSNEFDTGIAESNAGVQYTAGSVVYGVRAGRQQWQVGGDSFRRVNNLVGEAVTAFGEQISAYASVEIARYEHSGSNTFLDADYRALTGNLRWATGNKWQAAYTVQATVSREYNRQQDPSLDVRGLLLRLGWDAKPAERWTIQPAFMVQTLRYGGVDPAFGVQRDERYTQVELVANYKLSEKLTWRFELMRARYRSNAEVIKNNDWSSAGTALHWEFEQPQGYAGASPSCRKQSGTLFTACNATTSARSAAASASREIGQVICSHRTIDSCLSTFTIPTIATGSAGEFNGPPPLPPAAGYGVCRAADEHCSLGFSQRQQCMGERAWLSMWMDLSYRSQRRTCRHIDAWHAKRVKSGGSTALSHTRNASPTT